MDPKTRSRYSTSARLVLCLSMRAWFLIQLFFYNMKKSFKTKHGTVTVKTPDTINPDEKTLREAIKSLDSIHHNSDASVTRLDSIDERDNVVSSLVWTRVHEDDNYPI